MTGSGSRMAEASSPLASAEEPVGGPEDAAVAGHVLAVDQHPTVPLHLLVERVVDRLDEGHDRHLAQPPTPAPAPASGPSSPRRRRSSARCVTIRGVGSA